MPNDLFIQDRVRREGQLVFINTSQVPGVQSANIQYNTNEQYLNFIGCKDTVAVVPNGPQQGQVNISCLMIDNDPLIDLIGDTGANFYILKGRQTHSGNFSAHSGYVVNYTNRCGIGEIPSIDTNILVFGNVGKLLTTESLQVSGDLTTISGGSSNFALKIAGPGSIDLTLDDFNTNRVLNYSLSITTNRRPIYPLGSRTPTRVEIVYPIIVDFNCSFEIDGYQSHNMHAFPCKKKVRDITLTLKTFDVHQVIQTFAISDANLVGESYFTSTDGSAQVNANYRTYIDRNALPSCITVTDGVKTVSLPP